MLSSEIPDLVSPPAGYPAAVLFASSRLVICHGRSPPTLKCRSTEKRQRLRSQLSPTQREQSCSAGDAGAPHEIRRGVPPHPQFCFGESIDLAERGAMRSAATTPPLP